MNPLPPSQESLLRSLLRNALADPAAKRRVTILDALQETVLLSAGWDEDTSRILLDYAGNRPSHPAPPEQAVEELLRAFREHDGIALIGGVGQTTRVALRGASIIRETLDRIPDSPVLKTPLWAVGKATHLDPCQAAPLLQSIGLMTPEGEIKAPMRKKFKQINHFLELVAPLLRRETGSAPLTLADCGCGKTYLGFVLFWYVRRVLNRPARFYGIDRSEPLIRDCEQRAAALGLKDIEFQCAPILRADIPRRIHLLISLHACDTATDEALALAVAREAEHLAAAPCCQHELARQIHGVPHYPIGRHGLFKHRFADLLTDMARALFLESHGYTVTAGEFVSADDTPKNLLLRARRGNSLAAQRREEYETFKRYYHIDPSLDHFLLELEAGRNHP
ncbi:MAG: SAM-dependent methyltransferase [Candidatus Omnitrophica bacterium]|nr:SAM-dependent methyltransferase [Candidatus Omnitrophota bacterium]